MWWGGGGVEGGMREGRVIRDKICREGGEKVKGKKCKKTQDFVVVIYVVSLEFV